MQGRRLVPGRKIRVFFMMRRMQQINSKIKDGDREQRTTGDRRKEREIVERERVDAASK